MRNKPTFFTLWLGANDVLGWATGGGTGAVVPENSTAPWVAPGVLVNPSLVIANISRAVDSLTSTGAKGVLATIPYVNSTPYFTTVPAYCVALTRQGQVDTLNNAYSAAIQVNPSFKWVLGANAPVMVDSTVPGLYMRKVTPEDYIVLTATTALGQGQGVITPLKDEWVLDKTEAAIATDYTKKYNDGIKSIATAKGLALADMNAYMTTFTSGITYNGVAMNAKFISGGAFGLDGVHPTPKGYALIANEFIRVINKQYGSKIPAVDVNKYRGVVLP
jgi:lysophospholipase L1-like esterase